MIAEISGPKMKFRGWASGLSTAPYMSTLDAPKEAIRNMFSTLVKSWIWANDIRLIPIKAPRKDQKWFLTSTEVSLDRTSNENFTPLFMLLLITFFNYESFEGHTRY
jgi:hypothetical protein